MPFIPTLQGKPWVHGETAKTLKNIYNYTAWSNLKITSLKTKETKEAYMLWLHLHKVLEMTKRCEVESMGKTQWEFEGMIKISALEIKPWCKRIKAYTAIPLNLGSTCQLDLNNSLVTESKPSAEWFEQQALLSPQNS